MSAHSAVSHVGAADDAAQPHSSLCTAVNAPPLAALPLHHLHPYCSAAAEAAGPPHDSSSPTTITCTSSSSLSPPPPPPVTLDMLSTNQLADTLARVLSHMCARAQVCALPQSTHPLSFFYCPAKQSFDLSFYCRRLLQLNRCSKPCVALALVYMFRVQSFHYMHINEYNVHRLLCTALMLATKWHDDVSFDNAHYAQVAGIASTEEMNLLEVHMLIVLDHALFVNTHTYSHIESYLLQWSLCHH